MKLLCNSYIGLHFHGKKVSSPAQRRELVQQVIEQHDYSERRAYALVGLNRRTFRQPMSPDADRKVWQRLRELAQERPRFGSPPPARPATPGGGQNHKRTGRLYRAEGLSLRLKRRKKHLSHLRVVMPTPNGADESWAMDLISVSREFESLTPHEAFKWFSWWWMHRLSQPTR